MVARWPNLPKQRQVSCRNILAVLRIGAEIFFSGTTWSGLWSWGSYPQIFKWYSYDDSEAPWNGPDYVDTTLGDLQIGWMMEALAIDPFNSDNWYYGTGGAIMGGTDLTKWDTVHNISIHMLGKGMEETSNQALLSPPVGAANLISGSLDVDGMFEVSCVGF